MVNWVIVVNTCHHHLLLFYQISLSVSVFVAFLKKCIITKFQNANIYCLSIHDLQRYFIHCVYIRQTGCVAMATS